MLAVSRALRYATPAARLFPEAIVFLTDVLIVLTGEGRCSWADVADELTERSFGLDKVVAAAPSKLRLGWMDAYPHRPIKPQWWASVACRALEVLLGFAQLHRDIVSIGPLFAAAVTAASALQAAVKAKQGAKSQVCQLAATFVETIESTSGRVLEPLRLQQHRPVPLRTFEPDYEDGYKGRKTDPDKDRREMRKLKALHKKELKGAVRELRQDAKFMARVKIDKVCGCNLLFLLPVCPWPIPGNLSAAILVWQFRTRCHGGLLPRAHVGHASCSAKSSKPSGLQWSDRTRTSLHKIWVSIVWKRRSSSRRRGASINRCCVDTSQPPGGNHTSHTQPNPTHTSIFPGYMCGCSSIQIVWSYQSKAQST
jgi:hypothetical protein